MVLVNITHRPEHISLTKQLQRDNPLDLVPCVGSGVVRIDTLCFMARCRTRRLTQAISVYILACFIVLLLLWPLCYVLDVIGMCSVFWLS